MEWGVKVTGRRWQWGVRNIIHTLHKGSRWGEIKNTSSNVYKSSNSAASSDKWEEGSLTRTSETEIISIKVIGEELKEGEEVRIRYWYWGGRGIREGGYWHFPYYSYPGLGGVCAS
jgi:hypothetical protein